MTVRKCAVVLCVIGLSVMLGGCAGNEVKYGKLHAAHTTLHAAKEDCAENAGNRFRAINWAALGVRDLRQARAHMEYGSEEYMQVKSLMEHLSRISSPRVKNTDILCRDIRLAAEATSKFFEGELASAE